MRFFLLESPNDKETYGSFSHVGTWTHGGICKKCGEGTSVLVEPLQLEWDPGSDRIGDFSWCGYAFIVLGSVTAFFSGNGFECRYGTVEVMQPQAPTRLPRVTYPYHGPNLYWVIATEYVPLDETRSGVELRTDCDLCRQKKYTFRRDGLVVDKSVWSGQKMFRLSQYKKSGATYVTEEVIGRLIDQGFSNFGHIEAGVIQ